MHPPFSSGSVWLRKQPGSREVQRQGAPRTKPKREVNVLPCRPEDSRRTVATPGRWSARRLVPCSPRRQALPAGSRRHCLSRCGAWSAVPARWPSSGVHLLSLPRLVRVGVGLGASLCGGAGCLVGGPGTTKQVQALGGFRSLSAIVT